VNMLLAFSVYDSKAERFGRPFFAESKPLGLRAFRQAVMNPAEILHQCPEDFTLFHVGMFDPETGQLENGVCDSMATALAVKASLENGK